MVDDSSATWRQNVTDGLGVVVVAVGGGVVWVGVAEGELTPPFTSGRNIANGVFLIELGNQFSGLDIESDDR